MSIITTATCLCLDCANRWGKGVVMHTHTLCGSALSENTMLPLVVYLTYFSHLIQVASGVNVAHRVGFILNETHHRWVSLALVVHLSLF